MSLKAQATISTPASVRFPSQLVGQAGKSLLKNELQVKTLKFMIQFAECYGIYEEGQKCHKR